jgi:prepilin-type N-terminal cleavage/methylation domain-containing protein
MHTRKLSSHGFTIVELLVVIAIIGILAALLLAVLPIVTEKSKKKKAALEISQIVQGIEHYDSVYGRFPVSTAAQAAAGTGDFTYGAAFQTPNPATTPYNLLNATYAMNNSEVIAILMNYTNYPNGSGFTVNKDYQKNPQRTIFLNAKMSGWDPPQGGTPPPGVGNDLVYRDPWGNPYVISLDLNYDDQCKDAFYCLNSSSGSATAPNTNPGINGLVSPDTTKPDNYQFHGKVMVWSAGPDGKIDTGAANQGANKDNILSWVQ